MRKNLVCLLLCLMLTSVGSTGLAVTRYSITDLGSIYPWCINETGQVAGTYPFGWGTACRWQDGSRQMLSSLGHEYSFGYSINADGWIAGECRNGDYSSTDRHAVLWRDSVPEDLSPLTGDVAASASDINDLGQVVGSSLDSQLRYLACMWQDGIAEPLGLLPGDNQSSAFSVNNRSQVVGASTAGQFSDSHAFLWENGEMTDLGTLPGYDYSSASDINDAGDIVGESGAKYCGQLACLWRNGEISYLGTLEGHIRSAANAVNNHGTVVGMSSPNWGQNQNSAVVWEDGLIYDLNSLVPEGFEYALLEAFDINDSGQILVWGQRESEMEGFMENRGFLLTPVPEPSSMAALGLCLVPLAGVAMKARRRRIG